MSERVVIHNMQIAYGVQYEGKGYIDMELGRHILAVQYLPERIAAPLQAFIQALEEARAQPRYATPTSPV